MTLHLREIVAILARTPSTLATLFHDLPTAWLTADEGPDTFTPRDVLGHLIHGEKEDWVPRIQIILTHGDAVPFGPFDRFAFRAAMPGRSIDSLLEEFAQLRAANLAYLESLGLTSDLLARQGLHPPSAG